MVNQLIIIGNGFDLHCKLNTRFTDYFDSNKPAEDDDVAQAFINDSFNYDSQIMLGSPYLEKSSFWDIYFKLLESNVIKDWADVEKKLRIFFLDSEKENSFFQLTTIFFLKEYFFLSGLGSLPFFKKNQFLLETSNIDSSNSLLSKKLGKYITMKLLDSNGRYENKLKNLRNTVSIDNLISGGKEFLYQFLYDQLNIFEENLKGYIKKQIGIDNNDFEKMTKYTDIYNKTIQKMSGNNSYNLISFNYTKPIKHDKEIVIQSYMKSELHNIKNINPISCCNFINIHGTLNENIIIGIDEKNIDENDPLYKFTKTYRLFELNNNPNTCLSKTIKYIKFYGHSLAEADYSYFQSIFDFYDIYNSDVSLIFYYSNFDTTDQKHIMIDRVVKLIKTYGNTLNNKDHGKNLLHKLKLENRILIKELPD